MSTPMYVGLDQCSNRIAASRTCSSTACELEAIPSLTPRIELCPRHCARTASEIKVVVRLEGGSVRSNCM